MLTLDQLGISEEDWNQTPASVRAALMFLIQQNQRLENRCVTYQLQVQRLEAEMERLKKLELEVAELRERLGKIRRTLLNHPPLIRLQFHAQASISRVVASEAVNAATKGTDGHSCRPNKWIRSSSCARSIVTNAARSYWVMILSRRGDSSANCHGSKRK